MAFDKFALFLRYCLGKLRTYLENDFDFCCLFLLQLWNYCNDIDMNQFPLSLCFNDFKEQK